MISWVQSICGLFFVIGGSLGLLILLGSGLRNEKLSTRLGAVALIVGLVAFGIYLVWPVALLVIDLFRGSSSASEVISAREARRSASVASDAVWMVRINYGLAIFAALAAPFLANSLRRENPRSRSAWLVLLAIPLGLVLAWSLVSRTIGWLLPDNSLVARTARAAEQPAGFLPFAIWVEIIWLGMIYTRHVTSIGVGPVTIFLTPFALLPGYVGYYRDFHRAIQVLLWLVSVVLGFFVNSIREIENDFERERRNRRAEQLYEAQFESSDDAPTSGFSLYLRPFTATGTLDTQGKGQETEPLDFETILARAVKPHSQLLALSRPSEAEVVGAGRVFLPDSGWWVRFQELAGKATLIFLLPATSPGSLQEIIWLFEQGLLTKCIFVMPETPSGKGWQVTVNIPKSFSITTSHEIDHSQSWKQAALAIEKETGIRLPEYNPEGALFSLNADGTVRQIQRLELAGTFRRIRKVRKAIQVVA